MERLCSSGAAVAFPEASWPLGSGFEWDLEGDCEYLRVLVSWLQACYPEADRRVCLAETMSDGAPSYVELLECLNIARDTREQMGRGRPR